MLSGRPKLIAINHDDYHAQFIGKTADGRQFFLTEPFEPGLNGTGREFVAMYLFDLEGNLIDAKIEFLGQRATMDREMGKSLRKQWLAALGTKQYCRIQVSPFSIQRFGREFGLIVREPEDEDDTWTVTVEPGNYMAFFDPWDSGEYDT